MPNADAPARPLDPHDPRLATWRTFLQAQARLARRFDEELRSEHGLSLPEYDALLAIAESAERRIRMHHLAERVVLSKSGITRLVDRLVASGFVERSACSTDARGAEAVLTSAGLARLRRAAQTHLRGIDTYFLSVITPEDQAVLARSLGDVAARVGPGWSPTEVCAPDMLDADPADADAGAPIERRSKRPLEPAPTAG
jgi:DNA-binding MarR family transcriptional regulator